MKIEVIRSGKETAEFRLEGERHTFPNLLKEKLLEDKSVEFASYILEHPMGKNAKFIVKTKGKSPKKALEDAAKAIEEDLDDFGKKVSKSIK
ncbi:MAG: DNA-directed RNA polymerase subunit L [archaeon]